MSTPVGREYTPGESPFAGGLDGAAFSMVGIERHGVVDRFDEAAGLGEILDEEGIRFDFHCTQIADGSRTIDEDVAVHFVLMRTNLGRVEATAIRPCRCSSASA